MLLRVLLQVILLLRMSILLLRMSVISTLRHRMASSMAYSYHIGFLVDVLGYGGMITVLYHTDTYVQYRICECNRAASDDAVMQ